MTSKCPLLWLGCMLGSFFAAFTAVAATPQTLIFPSQTAFVQEAVADSEGGTDIEDDVEADETDEELEEAGQLEGAIAPPPRKRSRAVQ